MNNAITWFEIPAGNLERAVKFYESTLGRRMTRENAGPFTMAVFAYEQPGVGGCLIAGDGYTPGTTGNMIYLNAEPSIDAALERATQAGGKIALAKTALPDGMGFYAHVIDSEGNRVGLHALH